MSAASEGLSQDEALARIAAGGLVGVPTETEWGLAADAAQPKAVERLFAWKGREAGQAVSVFVTGLDAAGRLGAEIPEAARRLAERFWPGPLTLVVGGAFALAPGVCNAQGGLGLRCSPHPALASLVCEAERRRMGPLTATSLNRSGTPGARSRADAARAVGAGGPDAPALLEGECAGGAPSSVVDLSGARPLLLREGALSRNALAACCPLLESNAEDTPAAAPSPC